jgi:hypothetical protein
LFTLELLFVFEKSVGIPWLLNCSRNGLICSTIGTMHQALFFLAMNEIIVEVGP